MFWAISVFLLAAVTVATLIQQSESQIVEKNKAHAAIDAADYAQVIQSRIERALSATYALSAMVRQGNGQVANFDEVAAEMLPLYPGVSSLQLAPGGVIRHIVPLAGNEKAVGHDLLKDPARNKEAFIARDTGQLTLAGPFELIQGGLGAVGRSPVFLANDSGGKSFWGFVTVLIKFPDVHDSAAWLPQLERQGYEYELWRIHPDSGLRQIIAASSRAPLHDPVQRSLRVPNAEWTLSVAPVKGWNDSSGLLTKSLLGLLFCFLLAWLTKLLAELKHHELSLEALVAKRTAELQLREADLRRAQSIAHIGSWVRDIDRNTLRWSEETSRIYGMGGDLPGSYEDFLQCVHPGDHEIVAAAWNEALKGQRYNVEHRILVNGEVRWVHEQAELIKSADGQLVGVTGTVQDITERRVTEARLRQLSTAVEQSPASIVITDINANIEYVNPQFERASGYSAQEVLGKNPRILKSDKKSAAEYMSMWAALTGGQVWRGELENVRKDGALYTELASISPILDNEGRVTGYVAVKEDITQRKQVEAELRIAAIAFESQEANIITDADQVILKVNHAFTRITGYSAEEAVGNTPSMLKSGRHDDVFYRGMMESLHHDKFWQGEVWNRRKNGEIYPEWLNITAVTNDQGWTTNYVAAFSDITQHKQAEETIHNLAFHDPLTGLPNRRLLMDRLQQTLLSSSRHQDNGAILFIDLDKFKELNDTKGHNIGDLLLIEVAQRLRTCVRTDDTVARLGGDEFVVMLEELSGDSDQAAIQAEMIAEKVLNAINQPFLLQGHEFHSSPSIGISLFHDADQTVDEVLKRADTAMYQAKNAGRNTIRFFDPATHAAMEARMAIEADLRTALSREEFILYFQLQIDHNQRALGAEALLRWQHPARGLVPPLKFIPLAEETGLILPIGQWVMETAGAQLRAWKNAPGFEHLQIAVNVSARQFRQPDFVDQVSSMIARFGFQPDRLKIELTESMVLDSIDESITKMQALKLLGVRFSLDDFGTGYSSLAYLKRLPLDQIKIDQSFVRDITTDSNDAAIVKTIIAMADNLGLDVIAEGVETEQQREFLQLNGCVSYQGYLYSRPVPLSEFEAVVNKLSFV